MGLLSGSVLLMIVASVGSLAANVGLNTLQSFYDPLYADAFWGSQGLSTDRSAQLGREEAAVDSLMHDDGNDGGAAGYQLLASRANDVECGATACRGATGEAQRLRQGVE